MTKDETEKHLFMIMKLGKEYPIFVEHRINDGGGCTCKRQFVQDVTFRGVSLASTDFSKAVLDMVEFDEEYMGL